MPVMCALCSSQRQNGNGAAQIPAQPCVVSFVGMGGVYRIKGDASSTITLYSDVRSKLVEIQRGRIGQSRHYPQVFAS